MKNLIQTVQILRALAALAVVLVHSQYGAPTGTDTNFFSWSRMPEAGVDLFFVISGFIMMLVSDPAGGRENTPSVFMARRIQRIVPIYWVYTLALAVGALIFPSLLRFTTLTPEIVLKSLFFVPSVHPGNGEIQPLLSVGWTLQYEMAFYLCFAAILSLRLGARVLALAAFFAALMVLAGVAGRETVAMRFLGNPIVFEFVTGMGIYWLASRGLVSRLAALPIGAAFLAAIWLVGSGTAAPLAGLVEHRWVRPIAWGAPMALLVYLGVAMREVPGMAGRALARLGDASYSLYLCHFFVVAALLRVWAAMGFAPSAAFGTLVVMPCCIVAGLLSHHFIEKPIADFFRRSRRAVPPPARPAADPAGPESRPGPA